MPRLRSKLAEKSSFASQLASAVIVSSSVLATGAVMVEAISVDRVEAVWGVYGEVGESSQAIPIRAAHPSCPSWSTLGGLVVNSVETDETVTIIATFPDHDADVPCGWMGVAMRATVRLDRPLGDRLVIDGTTGADPATPVAIAFHTGQAPASSN